ncbi:MAG: SDR family NAD(P)-dependent oxidoreductase [Acidimicrobiia bacterium]|nr:SDR family NAD(P)-dependent oxidoreductase [Acidimicrobiia bacterium]
MRIDGARALVTGASRGLGAAIARALHAGGASPVLVARDREDLERLAFELDAEVIAGDLLDPEFAAVLVSLAGPIDILVNNAGMGRTGLVADQPPADIESVLRLNLVVPARLCSEALPSMIERGRGHIVNMSSLSMAVDTVGWASYGASKAGLSSFSESLRLELDGTGVGLTLVEIGFVDTDMLSELRADPLASPVFERAIRLRLQTLLDPDDVAAAVVGAISRNRSHVRLPRRTAALPAMSNLGRRATRLIAPRIAPPASR